MTQLQINISNLVSALKNNPDLPVIFTQNEQTISPGYHITEVKIAVVNSLDCGQGTDQWRELVIQLLDGDDDSSNAYMQSAKFHGILGQALKAEQVDDDTHLYFEFTPGNAAMQKSSIKEVEIVNNTIAITLATTTAQCKPYQRALARGTVATSSTGCCGPAPKPEQACCDTGSISNNSSCCT